jgi:hypothetical protein
MKHLLILLCVTTLVSCGIKDKLLNSTSGTLGVPKQPNVVTTPVVTHTDVPPATQATQSTKSSLDKTESTPIEAPDESFVNWYYVLPFVGLAILGFLVYRLKQQNLKSL